MEFPNDTRHAESKNHVNVVYIPERLLDLLLNEFIQEVPCSNLRQVTNYPS
jgi:hypothetical protein